MMCRAWCDLYWMFQHVRENPAMWVRTESLDELEPISHGYEIALGVHAIKEFGTGFRRRFSDYLQERFGWSLCQSWAAAIRRHSRAKDRGWKRFFDLLDQFAASPACAGFEPRKIDPVFLTTTVVALARGIYEERAFDRLPILADALMDAGCDNTDILDHLRGPGPHVRGCWALDLILGKE